MLRRAKELFGLAITAVDGKAGEVRDLYFDSKEWSIRYLVVDTGGWLEGRRVLISPLAVANARWDDAELEVALTASEVENSPHIDLDKPVSRQQVVELHEYYGWPAYWAGSAMMGTTTPGVYPMIMAGIDEIEREMEEEGPQEKVRGDPYLRSARAVSGYDIAATDGDIGRVDDYLIDAQDWIIRYVLVDTGDWLPGRKVLVPPSCVERVDWAQTSVEVALTREQVEASPEYDPHQPPTREYEDELHHHYGQRGYWCE